MANPQPSFRTPGRGLTAGSLPRVVGVLSSFFDGFVPAGVKDSCDIVEVRLDQIGPEPGWLGRCRAIESEGLPALLTVRSSTEGGGWKGNEEDRLAILKEGARQLSAVDIELSSSIAREVAAEARAYGKVCVVSHHDFEATPPLEALTRVVEEAREFASIVKISTMAAREKDVRTLVALLKRDFGLPLCVIGMGPLGRETRVSFPLLGSCLTYGYLDKPSAPGQFRASDLVEKLRSLHPGYNQDFIARRGV
jgi:3-dehydroquinate dehydratase-1